MAIAFVKKTPSGTTLSRGGAVNGVWLYTAPNYMINCIVYGGSWRNTISDVSAGYRLLGFLYLTGQIGRIFEEGLRADESRYYDKIPVSDEVWNEIKPYWLSKETIIYDYVNKKIKLKRVEQV